MKFSFCIAIVLLCFQHAIAAFPPQVRLHRLPYFRRPPQAAQPIRLRRNALDSALNKMSSAKGDSAANLEFIQSKEIPEQNTSYTADNSARGIVANWKIHDQRPSSSQRHTIKQTPNGNFYNEDNKYIFHPNAFKRRENPASGFQLERYNEDLEWSLRYGH